MRVDTLLAEFLVAEDVDTIFSLMSEEIIELTATFQEDWSDEIEVVQARHEQSAVAMADGYARRGNGFGVVTVGRGPAIAQTGTALVTAQKKGSNILVLVPQKPRSLSVDPLNKGFRQQGFLETLLDNVITIQDDTALVPKFADAFQRLHNREGPVAVQIPWDILESETDAADDWQESTIGSDRFTPSDAHVRPSETDVQTAVDLLIESGTSNPPVIMAGDGAVKADAKAALEDLAERAGALLSTSILAQGFFSDHPFSLGFAGNFGDGIANEYIRQADYVLAVGCSLNGHTTDEGRLLADSTVVQVDVDPAQIEQFTAVDLGIAGDARATAELLSAELERRGIDQSETFWTKSVEDAIAGPSPVEEKEYTTGSDRIAPLALMQALEPVLPAERVVVSDSGNFTPWVVNGFTIPNPEDFVWPMDFGTIGLAHPMAVGAAHAVEDRTMTVFCGDAGFIMSMAELNTAVRQELPLIIVVLNDDALGAEYQQLLSREHFDDAAASATAVIDTPDLATVAEGFGAEGHTISSLDDIDDVADRINEQPDGPVVLDCKIDRDVRHLYFDRISE